VVVVVVVVVVVEEGSRAGISSFSSTNSFVSGGRAEELGPHFGQHHSTDLEANIFRSDGG